MLKKRKIFLIIVISLVLSIVGSFNAISSPETTGPGEDLPDNNDYGINQDEVVGNENFWASWVPIHFGVNINAKLKPGDNSGSNVIYIDRQEGKIEGQEAVKGYGLYQFMLEKHMVGYLYYIKDKVKNTNDTSIIKSSSFFSLIKEYYKPSEACEYVANMLISSAYSEDTKKLKLIFV